MRTHIPWSNTHRFNQDGYSAPTIFPLVENYTTASAYLEDLELAQEREQSHKEWLWEQEQEARQEWLEYSLQLLEERG